MWKSQTTVNRTRSRDLTYLQCWDSFTGSRLHLILLVSGVL
jgi:hypothetical protein